MYAHIHICVYNKLYNMYNIFPRSLEIVETEGKICDQRFKFWWPMKIIKKKKMQVFQKLAHTRAIISWMCIRETCYEILYFISYGNKITKFQQSLCKIWPNIN